jgi:hypothetical protein
MSLAPAVSPLVLWVLRNAYRRPSIEHVAAVFQVTAKTITRTLARHDVPRFGALRELGMLLYAREMVTCHGLTRREAGQLLGWADGSQLSRLTGRWQRTSHGDTALAQWRDLLSLYPPPCVPETQDMSSKALV